MNATFANIFLAIQELIKTQAPFIKHTDQDLGQLKSQRPPVSWPCLLSDFEDFTFQPLAENVQLANGTIVFRLGFAPYGNTTASTPASYKTVALDYYDAEYKLHLLVQGWQPCANTGRLNRVSAATQKRTDNYRVRELRYSLSFDDYSTRPQQTFAPAVFEQETTIDLPSSL